MNDINIIIDDLINFNKELQIDGMIKLCNKNPTSHLCRYISNNNYEEWDRFLTIDNYKNLFSKGFDRLDTWKYLFSDNPVLYFSKIIIPQYSIDEEIIKHLINKLIDLRENKIEEYYFIFASLIILFQIFGDGNHRTAQYFLTNMGQTQINSRQMTEVNRLISDSDYYVIRENPIKKINELINKLIELSSISGGRKIKKMKYRKVKNKSKKIKNTLKNKSKKLK